MSSSTSVANDGSATSTSAANNRWPKQIKYIIGNEACERFSYYGMQSILAVYITNAVVAGSLASGLGQTEDRATEIIHLFGFASYFMPLFGAWLADKMIGRYHTIFWLSLFYCAGHGVLACSDLARDVHGRLLCLYTGLSLIAFGAGGIKPCVSAFMGDQFKPDQRHLLQKAYGAFYWSINFGSFFSFLVIPWIANHKGYSLAFGVPGILMALATLIFWLGTKHYIRIPPSRVTKQAGFFAVLWCALTTRSAPGQRFWDRARGKYNEREIDAAKSVLPILIVFALIPPFWSLFNQTNSTWVLQGKKMIPAHLFSIGSFNADVGAEEMQSANAALVMIIVPLFTLVLYPMLGKLASPLKRMSYGMFLAAASYLIVAGLQRQIEAGEQISVLWQTVPYIVITAAEVLVSTTGLEFAFREAAPEMKSLVMSFWLLTVAVGNFLVVGITRIGSMLDGATGNDAVTAKRFTLYAGMTFVVAILFSLVTLTYKYRDQSAAEGK